MRDRPDFSKSVRGKPLVDNNLNLIPVDCNFRRQILTHPNCRKQSGAMAEKFINLHDANVSRTGSWSYKLF